MYCAQTYTDTTMIIDVFSLGAWDRLAVIEDGDCRQQIKQILEKEHLTTDEILIYGSNEQNRICMELTGKRLADWLEQKA